MTRYSLLLIGGMALGLGACTGKGEAPVEAESTEAVNQGLASPEAGEAAKKPDEAPTPKKATVKVLPLGEGAVAIQPREDLTETAKKRTPWDNYALEDSLSLKYINEGKSAPFPGSQGYGAYKKDLVGSMLRNGTMDYKVVGNLYRDGVLAREKETEVKEACYKAIEAAGGDPAMKGNFIIGLIHVGYEDAAFEAIEKYRGEEWFAKNWDVNFSPERFIFDTVCSRNQFRSSRLRIQSRAASGSGSGTPWRLQRVERKTRHDGRSCFLLGTTWAPEMERGSRSRTRPTSTGSEDGI